MTAFERITRRTIDGLTACLAPEGCDTCPYQEQNRDGFECTRSLMQDALSLLGNSDLFVPFDKVKPGAEDKAAMDLYYWKAIAVLVQQRGVHPGQINAALGISSASTVSSWLHRRYGVSPRYYAGIDKLLDETEVPE